MRRMFLGSMPRSHGAGGPGCVARRRGKPRPRRRDRLGRLHRRLGGRPTALRPRLPRSLLAAVRDDARRNGARLDFLPMWRVAPSGTERGCRRVVTRSNGTSSGTRHGRYRGHLHCAWLANRDALGSLAVRHRAGRTPPDREGKRGGWAREGRTTPSEVVSAELHGLGPWRIEHSDGERDAYRRHHCKAHRRRRGVAAAARLGRFRVDRRLLLHQ